MLGHSRRTKQLKLMKEREKLQEFFDDHSVEPSSIYEEEEETQRYLPSVAIGCYPMLYFMPDGEALCGDCATKHCRSLLSDPDSIILREEVLADCASGTSDLICSCCGKILVEACSVCRKNEWVQGIRWNLFNLLLASDNLGTPLPEMPDELTWKAKAVQRIIDAASDALDQIWDEIMAEQERQKEEQENNK